MARQMWTYHPPSTPPPTHPHQTPATRHKKRTEEGSVSEIMRPRVPRLLRAPSADFIVCPLSARHTIVTHNYDCISRLIHFIYIYVCNICMLTHSSQHNDHFYRPHIRSRTRRAIKCEHDHHRSAGLPNSRIPCSQPLAKVTIPNHQPAPKPGQQHAC